MFLLFFSPGVLFIFFQGADLNERKKEHGHTLVLQNSSFIYYETIGTEIFVVLSKYITKKNCALNSINVAASVKLFWNPDSNVWWSSGF